MRRLDRRDAHHPRRRRRARRACRTTAAAPRPKGDQRRRLRRDVVDARDVAPRALAVGIDSGEPGNEPASEQGLARFALLGDARIGVGALEGSGDRRIDRAFQAAESFVVGEPQRAGRAIVEIELLQREGEQRQGVGAAACFDVGEQALCQSRLDDEFAAGLPNRRARPSITSL